MNNEDIETKLSSMDLPQPGKIPHQKELKIPLLNYKKSSRTGLWLLLVPAVVACTIVLKYELGISTPVVNGIQSIFKFIDSNVVLTYLMPLIFLGLPVLAMVVNFLAFCHYTFDEEKKELLITLKYRPFNIAIFLFALSMMVYFLLPDRLSF